MTGILFFPASCRVSRVKRTGGHTAEPPVAGDVNIQVTCGGSCANPTSTEVSLSLDANGLVTPFGLQYHMQAISSDPVISP